MSINKVEMQDNLGNVYYPHTDASIVKFGSSDVGSALSEIVQDVNDLDANKFNKYPTSIAGTINPITLAPGHYIVEGNLTTANGYPVNAYSNYSIFISGEFASTSTSGHRKIILVERAGSMYVKSQDLATWTNWQRIASNKDSALISNANMLNGWSNNIDQDWAKINVSKYGNVVQITIYGISGTNASVPVFTLPSICNSIWIDDSIGSGVSIVDKSVYVNATSFARKVFTYIE